VAGFIGNTGLLTALSFSRDQESAADKLAVEALVKHYGHAGGAAQLFKVFDKASEQTNSKVPEFFATHPLNENRTESIEKQSLDNGWALTGKLNNFPEPVTAELKRLLDENKEAESSKE
jgi:predicted Zn-dependent protease